MGMVFESEVDEKFAPCITRAQLLTFFPVQREQYLVTHILLDHASSFFPVSLFCI